MIMRVIPRLNTTRNILRKRRRSTQSIRAHIIKENTIPENIHRDLHQEQDTILGHVLVQDLILEQVIVPGLVPVPEPNIQEKNLIQDLVLEPDILEQGIVQGLVLIPEPNIPKDNPVRGHLLDTDIPGHNPIPGLILDVDIAQEHDPIPHNILKHGIGHGIVMITEDDPVAIIHHQIVIRGETERRGRSHTRPLPKPYQP